MFCRLLQNRQDRASYIVIALGSNVHFFARPHRRSELAQCFETVLGSPVRTVEFPGIDQPVLVVSFPGRGHLSVEFTDDATRTLRQMSTFAIRAAMYKYTALVAWPAGL